MRFKNSYVIDVVRFDLFVHGDNEASPEDSYNEVFDSLEYLTDFNLI